MDDPSTPVPESDNYLRKAMVNYLTLEKKDAYFELNQVTTQKELKT